MGLAFAGCLSQGLPTPLPLIFSVCKCLWNPYLNGKGEQNKKVGTVAPSDPSLSRGELVMQEHAFERGRELPWIGGKDYGYQSQVQPGAPIPRVETRGAIVIWARSGGSFLSDLGVVLSLGWTGQEVCGWEKDAEMVTDAPTDSRWGRGWRAKGPESSSAEAARCEEQGCAGMRAAPWDGTNMGEGRGRCMHVFVNTMWVCL